MILIADSGSTKTTWAVTGSDNKIVTEGLNPHFTSDEAFLAACSTVSNHFQLSTFNFPIYFYGAGCSSEQQRERVASLLYQTFGSSEVHVETDMLGACRGACGRERGLVGILGTGSNACYFDGDKISLQAVSTGYILGDEGSANYVGRRLLQDYLTRVMPRNLISRFHDDYPLTKEEFLDAVYHHPHANRFLASLAQFAVKHINDDYCSSEILIGLYNWYNYQLEGLQRLSLCNRLYLVGGFAAHIRSLLDTVAKNKELEIQNVIADPMEGLLAFHSA